ncbi:cleavage stimulation factor subunit 2 isoform X1 [Paramormyrops kingsleyae]|uniref:cleavage stimulation factor subunit 2 isoform X1 n=1 Tax=Paramormyrops kingsleyae TaxID=1676925 RepID=UPI000CD63A6C|nr:cleavage stimulation factor subunit 2 isoform X1 [Paramormyrops kingsleyae]
MANSAASVVSAAGRDPAVDRSLRSVFVGNIPYEATEEQLKDIFSEVGLVVSFRLVYDRETGKPKGYGFCEYQDQETALSAMRNLNGREFSGRALRVDNAASEKNKEELKSLGTGAPVIESPYGDGCQPEEAPESISRAVASLPPEQMFELMKQMKLCVQNSPQEARNMLLQNPQLAYALLQAQVVMRIVDPEIALKMLHRQTPVQPLVPSSQVGAGPGQPLPQQNVPQPQPMVAMHVNGAPQMMQPSQMVGGVPGPMPGQGPMGPAGEWSPCLPCRPAARGLEGPLTSCRPLCSFAVGMQPQMGLPQGGPVPMDRGQGSLQHSPVGSSAQAAIERPQVPMADPRAPLRGGVPPGPAVVPPRGLLGDGPNDPRGGTLLSVTGEVVEPSRSFMGGPPHPGPPMHMGPPEMRGPHDMRGGPMMEQRGPPMEARAPIPGGRDPRAVEARGLDGRGPVSAQRVPMATGMQGPVPHGMGAGAPPPTRPAPGHTGVPQGGGGFSPGQSQVTSQDHEKAALIMQVLQLTPEQIAMLPPEQRQSILILKEQIQKTAGAP